MSDSSEPRSSTRRTFVLLCLAAAAAFVVTFLLVRSPADRVSTQSAASPKPATLAVNSGVAAPAAANRRVDTQQNPAVQKAGPPNPEALRTAAASAESAARAAADLAGSATN
jgi:hypothetical protein